MGLLPTNTIECHDEGALLLVRGSKRRGSCVRSTGALPAAIRREPSEKETRQAKPKKNDREMRSWSRAGA
jgi:hypothetical protein